MEIKIKVEGSKSVPYKKLNNFQGDLKILTESNYQRFKNNILINGFIEPISTWLDPSDKKLKILNGHQRLATVKRMVENENYQIADIPINIIEADNIQDAKKKVLALTSEYGEMTREGVHNFISGMELDTDELSTYLKDVTNLKSINIDEILADFEMPDYSNDDLNVDNINITADAPVVGQNPYQNDGSESPQNPVVRQDPMTGLRLLQIFLTNEQLDVVKAQIDEIIAHYKLSNTTDAIIKAIELTSQLTRGKDADNSSHQEA